ncbi:aldo/keto reductase [bacterium]|nr:aldo/keto reductase [bacterium]
MKNRLLGKTGLAVSEIGFGTWGIGGAADGDVAYGPTDDEESKRALERAYDLGVTFYDTSDLYGFGHSERILGSVFKKVRDKVVIASKSGFIRQDGDLKQDFSIQRIRQSLEESLRRLQTDYIDLYQLHSPPVDVIEQDPAILETLRSLQRAGKIRAFGISARSPDEARLAVQNWGVPCVQVNFNLTDQRVVENGLMDLCRKEDTGLIIRTPLCFGFLVGTYSANTPFDPRDHRSKWPAQQLEAWAGAPNVFSPLLNYPHQTPAQLALRFCLSYSSVSTVIPGMLTADQVTENSSASALGPFTDAERSTLEEAYKRHTFFVKKSGS